MTTIEALVLDELRPGGMLTLDTIARATRQPKWRVRRAANSLRLKSLAWQNRRGEWQAYR